jgi:hemolysin activation/secretion protein
LKIVVKTYKVEGDNPIGAAASEALAPFVGEFDGLEPLYAAKDAINAALASGGYRFYRAVLPPQDIVDGVVTIKILALPIGKVVVEGNKRVSAAAVERSVRALKTGEVPNTAEVSRSLAVVNEHPSKKVQVNFRESEETPDTLDAVLKVAEEKPWSVFAQINNIGSAGDGASDVAAGGTAGTGRTRLTMGGQYDNLTRHDDVLQGSVTTSPENAENVLQYASSYQLPIYRLNGWLTGFYVHSEVDVDGVQGGIFDIQGAGTFYGLSFKHQLVNIGRYKHSYTLGVQDRLFDTAIFTSANGLRLTALSTKVRSRPFSGRYDGSYSWSSTSVDFYWDVSHNIEAGNHNNATDYALVRAPATPDFTVGHFGALVTQRLPRGFAALGRMTAQLTGQALIPGEQLGAGGVHSVRGFEERTIAGDKGVILNFELWSPPVKRLLDARFLGFIDVGHKALIDPVVGQRQNDTISSIGLGARWQWRKQLSLAIDYGLPLASADGEASDRGNSKWHLDLTYRY